MDYQYIGVALLAEGVDRNNILTPPTATTTTSPSSRRAWIEISLVGCLPAPPTSPSSRRAWIEIAQEFVYETSGDVALLAEGVDRNRETATAKPTEAGSPSSRRAWIEISFLGSSGSFS